VGKVQIKGAEHPIGKIFSNDFVFKVPLYQRPYSWQREQAEELLDDLLGFIGDGTGPVADLNPYFLGSIVVIKEDHKPEADIVDGQQRLTTLTILLSAIRSMLTGSEAAAVTGYVYEKGNPIEDTQDRFRLTLRERDAAFFQDHVQREGTIDGLRKFDATGLPDSQQNIKNNAVALLDRLAGIPDDRRKRLVQFIVKQCLLVVVSTPDFDSAYRIFTILNNRGMDLSHSDILKSEVIGRIPPAQQEQYNEKWEDAEVSLGREGFSDLFSYTRTIYRKLKAKGTVLAEFREYVLKALVDPKKLIDDVLIPFADAYGDIKRAAYVSAAGADEINRLLRWLNRIDNVDWLPPAILYLSRSRNDPPALRRFFTDLERLAAVLMLLRLSINHRIERYGNLTTAIENGDDLYASTSPLQLTAEEQAEATTALDGDVYTLQPKLRTYVLLRLDEALSGGGATYDDDLITVEHVLPQTPERGSQWESWFPDQAVRDKVVHRLGNLALLTRKKNSSARNYEFEKKKTSYFVKGGVSPFRITTQVLGEKEWTPAVVEKRQKELVGRLKVVWRI
jgi:hypothetical protein